MTNLDADEGDIPSDERTEPTEKRKQRLVARVRGRPLLQEFGGGRKGQEKAGGTNGRSIE
jgi:hypothetical protein